MNCKLKVKFEMTLCPFPHHRNVTSLHFSKESTTNSLTKRKKKLLKYNMWPKEEAVKRAGDQNKKKLSWRYLCRDSSAGIEQLSFLRAHESY